MNAPAAPAVPAFYESDGLSLEKPGTLLRQERVTSSTGATAWRMLYTSTHSKGLRAVSALAAVPAGDPPAGGWPVVTIGHTTTGCARICAPSLDPFGITTPVKLSFYDWMLRPFVEAGLAAIATDYRGLGTPGPHPYLAGELEAMDLLDAARAIRALEPRCGSETLVWGHSQGGQASACAAEAAASYAPELRIPGAVCAAPAVELVELLGGDATSPTPSPATGVLMMAVWGWAAVYEGIDLDTLLTPAAKALLPVLEQKCLQGVVETFIGQPPTAFFAHGLNEVPWPALFARNTPGSRKTGIPLLVTQGEVDTTIPPQLTAQFVQRLQAAGDEVAYQTYPGIEHFGLVHAAMPDTLTWMKKRLGQ